jgi:hypothetical protein
MTDPTSNTPTTENLGSPRGWVRVGSLDPELIGVVTRVKSGEMSPDQAEVWAKERGHSPFVPSSEQLSTEALRDRYWPFALAMAWIATRQAPQAMHAWASYMTWGPAQFLSDAGLVGAREALLAGLRQGHITASGRSDLRRPLARIPVVDWLELHLVRYGGHDRFCRDDGSLAYFHVVVDAHEVRASWPDLRPGEANVLRTAASEAGAKQRLIALMREQPDDPTPKAKLRPRFLGVSDRAFDRIYLQAVAEANAPAWSAPGRRPNEPKWTSAP